MAFNSRPARGAVNGRRRARIRAMCSGGLPILAIGFPSAILEILALSLESEHPLQFVSSYNGAVILIGCDRSARRNHSPEGGSVGFEGLFWPNKITGF